MKAVISTAGFGTRMFPVTAAVNKSLLPIGNRPVIDYLLAELLAAGVRDIAVVTFPGDDSIRRYVEPPEWIRRYFHDRGWAAKYAPIEELRRRFAEVRFTWIEQPVDGRYGTAVPPLLAEDFVGDDDWLLLTGDDLVLPADGGNDLLDMITSRVKADAPAAMQVTPVPAESVSRYGIVRTKEPSGEVLFFDDLVEKPAVDEAPTNLANISRYLLPADFFDHLRRFTPDPRSGEYLFTTALCQYGREQPIVVAPVTGTYHDCGNTTGWLEANIAVSGGAGDIGVARGAG